MQRKDNPTRIFVVEDDAFYKRMLNHILSMNPDHEVHTFSTGSECLEQLVLVPDVVTLDLSLPDLPGVVIWGLCDGASAACLYVAQDPRIRGLVLANPWVRSERSEAATYIRHYYLQRLLNPEFWRKLARGGLDWRDSLGSLAGFLRRLRSRPQDATAAAAALPYPQRMAAGLAAFGGDVLLLLSGQDLTAREFSDHAASDPHWQAALGKCRVSRETLADANHTFSSREWRDQVARLTGQWLAALPPSAMQPANPLAETPAT